MIPGGQRRLTVRERIEDLVIALVVDVDETGRAKVRFSHEIDMLCAARSLVDLTRDDIGRNVVLMFERGNPLSPLILGKVRESRLSVRSSAGADRSLAAPDGQVEPEKPRRLELEAHDEVSLRCGSASITLTKAGKIFIRGADIVSRASGLQRILGAVLRLN